MDYPIIQYVDDTLVILPACPVHLNVLKNILDTYAASTGLHINYHKSSIALINMSSDMTSQLADLMGCTVVAMPFTYLGLPLGIPWWTELKGK
jgi:hypothetical protein